MHSYIALLPLLSVAVALPQSSQPPASTQTPTCTTGSAYVVPTGGWTITYASVSAIPTPAVEAVGDASFVVDSAWAKEHLIAQQSQFDFKRSTNTDGYREFKCQLQCHTGCNGWFVGYDSAAKGMTCIQYDALIPSDALLEVVDSNASYVNGSAFNRLC